jgi:hypothetical protein
MFAGGRLVATQGSGNKVNVLGGISDFIILILLVGGAAFGGYYYGIHQQLAPIQNVPPGTPGAVTLAPTTPAPAETAVKPAAAVQSTQTEPAAETPAEKTASEETTEKAKPAETKSSHPLKYWLASSGDDYTGYSITVTVNGNTVDNFFGPGKNVDVTRHVKKGDNTILFDAKAMGDQYNKHKGDADAKLTVKLVSGPQIQENFKSSDVLLSYTRNSAEDQDFSDTKHFAKK